MDFLSQAVNDRRFHEDEVLLLALLQAVDPKVVTLSLGEVPVEDIIERLRERVEKNVNRAIQQAAEREANKVLGRKDPFELFFGPPPTGE